MNISFSWSFSAWWAQVDSNHRPRAYQARALTTWAMSPCQFSVYLVSSQPVFSSSRLRTVRSHALRRDWVRTLSAGGDDGNRTHDPLLAGQVLSQLSYTPIKEWRVQNAECRAKDDALALLFFALFSQASLIEAWQLNNKLLEIRCVHNISARFFVLIWLRGLKCVLRA